MTRRRSEGTSRPWERADGRWEGRYTDARGKRRSVYGRDANDVRRQLRERLNQRDEGVAPDGNSVGGWIDRWSARLDTSGLATNTIGTYRYHLALVPDWLRRLPIDQVEPELIDDALLEVGRRRTRLGTPTAPATVAKVRTLLGDVFDQAVRYRRLSYNPARATDPVHVPEEEVEPLTVEESARLREAAGGHRLYSLLTVGFGIGLRTSESIGALWRNVDLDTGVLHVRKQTARNSNPKYVHAPTVEDKDPKTRTSRRRIELPGRMVDDLAQRRSLVPAERLAAGAAWQDSGRVWCNTDGSPLSHSQVQHLLAGWSRRAGIRHVHPHLLRHSAGTLMLAAGIGERAIMDILGHSDLSMIRRYQHMSPPVARDAADRLGAALDLIDDERRVVRRVVNDDGTTAVEVTELRQKDA